MMQALEGFKMGFGLIMGGAVAVLIIYVVRVLLPDSGTSKGKMRWK